MLPVDDDGDVAGSGETVPAVPAAAASKIPVTGLKKAGGGET